MKRALCSPCPLLFVLAAACAGPGGGNHSNVTSEPQRRSAPTIEEVATLQVPPGNIAVGPDGRVFFTLHQFYNPAYPVAELVDGVARRVEIDHPLVSPLGIAVDETGTLWLLDNGLAKPGTEPALVARKASGEIDVHPLGAVSPKNAFLNDFVVDLTNDYVYIADPAGGSNAALVVLDLSTGQARRLLEGHVSVAPEEIDLIIDGEPVTMGQGEEARRPHIGVNPIAADAGQTWLYFGAMHGRSMYRIRTADLRDASLSPAALAERVERFSEKPICDGIAIDEQGRIYLGDLAQNAIGIIGPDGRYRILARGPQYSWMDAFAVGPDGSVYTPSNQLHHSAPLHGGKDVSELPFRVFRIRH